MWKDNAPLNVLKLMLGDQRDRNGDSLLFWKWFTVALLPQSPRDNVVLSIRKIGILCGSQISRQRFAMTVSAS